MRVTIQDGGRTEQLLMKISIEDRNVEQKLKQRGKLNNQYTIERVQLNSRGNPIFIDGKEVTEKLLKTLVLITIYGWL